MTRTKDERPIQYAWTLYVDKSLNKKGNEVGVILEGPNDIILEYSLKFDFKATNNQVEYEALLAKLLLVREVRAWSLNIRSDSQLVIAQLKGEYKVKEPLLIKYAHIAKRLLKGFEYDLQRIPREENVWANALAKLVSGKATINNKTIIQEMLQIPCTDRVMNVEERVSWMTPIVQYLKIDMLPSNKKETKKVERQSTYFFLENDQP